MRSLDIWILVVWETITQNKKVKQIVPWNGYCGMGIYGKVLKVVPGVSPSKPPNSIIPILPFPFSFTVPIRRDSDKTRKDIKNTADTKFLTYLLNSLTYSSTNSGQIRVTFEAIPQANKMLKLNITSKRGMKYQRIGAYTSAACLRCEIVSQK